LLYRNETELDQNSPISKTKRSRKGKKTILVKRNEICGPDLLKIEKETRKKKSFFKFVAKQNKIFRPGTPQDRKQNENMMKTKILRSKMIFISPAFSLSIVKQTASILTGAKK
jgi:hypothetical protein